MLQSMFRKTVSQVAKSSRRLFADGPPTKDPQTMVPVLSGERGINQVTLIGRVGQDAQMRGTEERPVTTFSLATSQSYRLADGSYQQFTDWHRISVFRKYLQDRVATTVKKGDRVYVQGAIRYGQYMNKEGQNVNSASIIADDVVNFSRVFRPEDDTSSYKHDEPEQ